MNTNADAKFVIDNAKEIVILAGKQLVESGLIARTWGNVSCRISDKQFVITPSGRAYETLTPDEIAIVNIDDCSYDGNIKPSSEKGLHAQVYKNRPDINFIIHTHQINASVVSPLKLDIMNIKPETASFIGNKVVTASYGLPGTKKLIKGVSEALKRSNGKAFIMAHHGALCLGKDYDEAFKVASALENVCSDFIKQKYMEKNCRNSFDFQELREYFLKKYNRENSKNIRVKPLYSSEKIGGYFKLYMNGSEKEPFDDSNNTIIVNIGKSSAEDWGKIPEEAEIHRAIYQKNKGINAVIHSTSPDILTVSQSGQKMKPLLDDFAQIIGTCVKTADWNGSFKSVKMISRKLKGRYAVLIKSDGALCCGPSKSDAQAAVLVMEKGCKTMVETSFFDKVKPINPIECALMRFVYIKKYSKQVNQK